MSTFTSFNGYEVEDSVARKNTKDLINKTNTLEERMNTFSKLETGSTTGDAELLDARIDFKGKSHENLGSHIRTVTSELNDNLSKLKNQTGFIYNALEKTTITDGFYVSAGDGIVRENSNYKVTGSIPVTSGDVFTTTRGVVQFAYYLNETFVSGVPVAESSEIAEFTVPEGVNQILFSLRREIIDNDTGIYFCTIKEYYNFKNLTNTELQKTTNTLKNYLGMQLLDEETTQDGLFYTIKENTLIKNPSSSTRLYKPIPITAGETYYLDDLYGFVSIFQDVNGNLSALTDDTTITRFSGLFTKETDGLLYPTAFIGEPTSPKVYKKKAKNISIIECGEGKEYTTLRSAIEMGTKLGAKVIVYPGTYDLTVEFADVIASQNGTGCKLGNGIEVVFMGGSYVKAIFDASNTWEYTYFEPFVAVGDFTLDGLNIEAANCRYCVHDDTSGIGTQHHVFKNCIMKYTNEHTSPNHVQCIGGGLGEHTYIDIIGGEYTTVNAHNRGDVISYHNGEPAGCDGKIFIKDVYLAGNGCFRFGMYGESIIKTPIFINGCSMGAPINVHFETTEYNNENFELKEWNNIIRN